jgi:hypothetical protein
VLINGRDMVLSPLDHALNTYIEPNSINYFETIIPYDGFALVEMSSCIGDMQFGYN